MRSLLDLFQIFLGAEIFRNPQWFDVAHHHEPVE